MKRFAVLAIVLSYALAAPGQARNATVTGLITDPSGAVVPGAAVSITNTLTNITQKVASNNQGEYNLLELPPGKYILKVEAQGFEQEERADVVLDVAQSARLDFALKIGATESLHVTDAPPLLESQSSEISNVIDNQKVNDLPLNGRQYYSLAQLSPAVLPPAQNSTNGYRGGFNVAGQPEIANNFYLNGIVNVDEIANYPAFRPSVETIQEFKLQTGTYAAEYGLRNGGQVEVVTKQGGSQFHGDLFEFIRNQVTDAKPYFLTNGGLPTLKQNQFGGTIGGPIWKGRTFFFFGFEGIQLRQGVAVLTTVPTGSIDTYNMRNGDFRGLLSLPTPVHVYIPGTTTDFSTPNVVDSAYISTFGQAIAHIFPQPTFQTPGGTAPSNNYLDTDVSREAGNEGSLRIDHKLDDQDQLFLNYNIFNDPNYGAYSGQCGNSVLPGFGCDQTTVSQVVAVGEMHTFNANLINEFRLGGNRYHQRRSVDPVRWAYWNTLNTDGLVPETGGAGLTLATTNYPGTSFGMVPNNRFDTTRQISDTLTWVKGNHTVKGGYTWINNLAVYVKNIQGSATLTFTPPATATTLYYSTGYDYSDILVGRPYSTSYTPFSTLVNTHPTISNHLFYIQDDWKILPTLTLNYGLRYELSPPMHEDDGFGSVFDPALNGGAGGFLATNGENGASKYPYHVDKNNFAPRLGLAWRPLHNDGTVIRAGSGIYFYSTPTLTTGLGGWEHQLPYAIPGYSFIANKTTSQLALVSANTLFPINGPAPLPNTAFGFDSRFATPYILQYSLGVQQALTTRLSLDVSYLGSTGSKLLGTSNINQPAPNPANTTTALQNAARPFTNFGNITWGQSTLKASYNALLVKLQQNYGSDLSFIASFTYAHAIDDGAGIISAGDSSKALPQDSYDQGAEKGSSDFDIKDRFAFSPVYDLPFGEGKKYLQHGIGSYLAGGWRLSGIFSVQTGTPFTVYNGGSNNNRSYTAQLSDRPNYVSNPNTGGKQTAKNWFNTSAFALQSAGTFGTSGRNTVRGPHYVDVDTAVSRDFPIGERTTAQLRVEGFNVLNHPNLYNPNGTSVQFGTQAFGTITNSYAPRQLQAALKFVF